VRSDDRHESASLRDLLHVARRRKWVILQAAVLLPLGALVFSHFQPKVFEGSSEILLSRQSAAATLAGTPDSSGSQPAERVLETQAELARIPQIANRVVEAAAAQDLTPQAFLAASQVIPKPTADLLEFRVTDREQERAARLANEYARQFIRYRAELHTANIERALVEVRQKLEQLDTPREQRSARYTGLLDTEQQLDLFAALQTRDVILRAASSASQIQPQTVRNVLLGLALGLMLGIALAFLFEALDTRVLSATELSERLGLPLLGRVPQPSRRMRRDDLLVMLEEPNSLSAEAFRMLRTNLDRANLEQGARTIMVTSAVEGEGKSTTVANLAVAYARTGKRVVLVDLDLRRSILDRFFQLEGRPGLTDVAAGRAELESVIAKVRLTSNGESPIGTHAQVPLASPRDPSVTSNGGALGELLALRTRASEQTQSRALGSDQGFQAGARNGAEGALEVLPSGLIPPDPGEFIGSQRVAGILHELSQRADLVLIDAPPLLHVGDAMTLSEKVDALFLVARLNVARRPMLDELRRLLATSLASPLGFVLSDAEHEATYGYSGSYHQVTREEQRV
jgi:Mrp family chromosome partitioning ATPase/capsular polysaccharide biosynthesis protein